MGKRWGSLPEAAHIQIIVLAHQQYGFKLRNLIVAQSVIWLIKISMLWSMRSNSSLDLFLATTGFL